MPAAAAPLPPTRWPAARLPLTACLPACLNAVHNHISEAFIHAPCSLPPSPLCQAAVAAKFPPAAPSAVSLFFPDGTELDDDDAVEVGASLREVGEGLSVCLRSVIHIILGYSYWKRANLFS